MQPRRQVPIIQLADCRYNDDAIDSSARLRSSLEPERAARCLNGAIAGRSSSTQYHRLKDSGIGEDDDHSRLNQRVDQTLWKFLQRLDVLGIEEGEPSPSPPRASNTARA